MWTANPGCSNTMAREWATQAEGTPMLIVAVKLKRCKKKLKKWIQHHFGNVKKQIKETKELLWQAEANSVRDGNYQEVVTLKAELNKLYDKEEQMWHQRSRVQWIKSGDRNTKFFHGTTTQRKRRNFIKGLRDNSGVWQTKEGVISQVLVDFYAGLFTTSNTHYLESILEGVQEVVTWEMNTKLTGPYTREEVECAIKEMAPLKALGPDGMPPLFYQTYWSNMGIDITQAVLSCLNSGSILKSINHTFIALIPKVKNPERVSEFRPISLCNVIYKIVCKVIANRLKPMLNNIISETQSAFIAERLIIDNILITYESLHYMKTSCTGKTGFMALKLDMSKAYDRMKWVFLEKILLKMDFHRSWVSLIMERITTISYSILVNGKPQGMISPTQGIRQGALCLLIYLFFVQKA